MTGLIDGFSNSLYDDACKAHKEYYVLNYGIMYNLLKDTQEIIDEIAETIILVKAYKLPLISELKPNIKQCFNKEQRKKAQSLKIKISKQSKSGEFKINVLYILYSKKDGTSETTTVFYFEAKDTSIKYIDLNGNVYKNWNKYLENNWIDSALVVYPEVGHYCHASVFHHESEPKLDMSESSLSIKRKNGDKVPVNSDIATAPELAYKFQEVFQEFIQLSCPSNPTNTNNIDVSQPDSNLSSKEKLFSQIIHQARVHKPDYASACISVLSGITRILDKADRKITPTDYLKMAVEIFTSYGIFATLSKAQDVSELIKTISNSGAKVSEEEFVSLICSFIKQLEIRQELSHQIRVIKQPLESATALAGIDTSNSPSRSNLLETFDNFAINHGLTLNGIVNTELSDNNRNRLNQILQCNENPTLWKTVETLTKLLNCDNAHMVAGLIEIVIFEVEITTAGFSDKKQRKAEKFEEFEEGFKKVLHDRQNNITIPSEYKVFLARIEERTNHFEERYRKQDPNIVNFYNFVETDGPRAAAFEAYGHGLKKYYSTYFSQGKLKTTCRDNPRAIDEWINEYLKEDRMNVYSIESNKWVRLKK